ncbi:MAG: thioredoxin domain-containing protein, partial [Terriglobia bacterium]
DMTSPKAGFYSAEDADSLLEPGKAEHAEGAFYVWTREQVVHALGEEQAKIFNAHYGVSANGNAPAGSDPHGEFTNKNILIQRQSISETAKTFHLSETDARKALEESRQRLFELRAKRPRPHLDDKIVTAWNGLMISAFARASQVLDEPLYAGTATAAAEFLQAELYDLKTHTLRRSYRQGSGKAEGFLSDYAFLIQGLIDLYEASFETRWLAWAEELQKTQDALFWDAKQGGYFDTSGQDAAILLRMKEDYDGAEPAPNSVAALNLLRLAHFMDAKAWREKAEQTFRAFASQLRSSPSSLPQMLVALDLYLGQPKQIVIAGSRQNEDLRAMLREVHKQYLPNKVIMLADGGEGQRFLAQHIDFIQSVKMQNGKATAYICENYVCQLPTTDLKIMARLLQGKRIRE